MLCGYKQIILCASLLSLTIFVAAGCGRSSPQAGTEAAADSMGPGSDDSASSASAQALSEAETEAGHWKDESTNSAVDGRIIKKTLHIVSSDEQGFVITAQCVDESDRFTLTIASGKPDGTDSANVGFVYGTNGTLSGKFLRGVARIPRFKDTLPLDQLAYMDRDFDNVIRIDTARILGHYQAIRAGEIVIKESHTKSPSFAYFTDFLPLAMRVTTGNGEFEIVVPRSPEMLESIYACGGSEPTLDQLSQQISEQDAAEKAKQEQAEAAAAAEREQAAAEEQRRQEEIRNREEAATEAARQAEDNFDRRAKEMGENQNLPANKPI